MMYFGLILILFLILSVSALSSRKQKGKDFSGKKSASSALVLGGIVGTIVWALIWKAPANGYAKAEELLKQLDEE